MVCYTVPLTIAVMGFIARKRFNWKGKYAEWFNLLFLGGALFGVIDHLWNQELFLISENWFMDLMLGVTISAITAATWAIFVYMDKSRVIKSVEVKS